MERISGKGWNQSIFHWTWKKIRIFFVPRQGLWFPYLFHPVCDGKIKCYISLEEKVLNQVSDMVSPFISAFLSNSHLKWHLGNKMLCANIFLHSHNYLWNCSLVLGCLCSSVQSYIFSAKNCSDFGSIVLFYLLQLKVGGRLQSQNFYSEKKGVFAEIQFSFRKLFCWHILWLSFELNVTFQPDCREAFP